jgi:hypothetical protein
MKLKFWGMIGLLLAAQVSMAQLHFGVKGGANLTKIDGQSFTDGFKTGYHLGGFAEIGFGGKLGIQPEVLFNQFKSTIANNADAVIGGFRADARNKDIKLNYLSIPILLNYKLVGNFLKLQVGPQFGILIDQDKTLVNNGMNAFKKGEFSLQGGLQARVAILYLTARYGVGLNNINDVTDQQKWKNQTVQFSVGIGF